MDKTPVEIGGKVIKEMEEKELKKHKVAAIMGFVKSGNLPMVHGLVRYHQLGHNIILLNGCVDEFTWGKGGAKHSMANWNPLLVAIAFKKLDIVRYLIHHLKISMSWASLAAQDDEESVKYEKEALPLCLTVVNKDLPMLTELWS